VPSTPNPTTGFMQLVEREIVYNVDMSVEQALKLLISGGATLGPAAATGVRAGTGRGVDGPAAG
jgi:uncharacterized membrane protein